ncbi:MAG: 3-phosphoshikimate 1-carboxyvinyltransferase [Flavobacteriaceae bacterium]|nr:3-phosphoshikimate 1-carboxyvinyltransferase [Flavobacteriaceae bacterium]MDG2314114.1 3-phosphoshikimate 1-carboxyvinyltransferase [Flavobacteriaceae bacterium]
MNVSLQHLSKKIQQSLSVTGSKSESNRLLLLQALFPNLVLENLSNSDDTVTMQTALATSHGLIDIHHAGTAMRFLTAYLSIQEGKEFSLTGSQRMQERPIQILVEALGQLGADIEYEKNKGFPPLKIRGKKLKGSQVTLPAHVSSQYITALLLIAPSLPNGLTVVLEGKITSIPYIKMSLSLLNQIGVSSSFEGNTIKVHAASSIKDQVVRVESDWSSASYFYSIAALSEESEIKIESYKKESLQGDSVLQEIYCQLGVETNFQGHSLVLSKKKNTVLPKNISLDLSNAPDIAQTIAVSCFGLGISCDLTGLHTLKIKETDRLEALNTELSKLGAKITVTNDSLHLKSTSIIAENIAIDTYNDHRMAMAFAPLALKTSISINDAEVVSKSYPDFWADLQAMHFTVLKIS